MQWKGSIDVKGSICMPKRTFIFKSVIFILWNAFLCYSLDVNQTLCLCMDMQLKYAKPDLYLERKTQIQSQHAIVFILKTHYANAVCVLYENLSLCDNTRKMLWLRHCCVSSRNQKQHKTCAFMSYSTCSCVYVDDTLCICSACCALYGNLWLCDTMRMILWLRRYGKHIGLFTCISKGFVLLVCVCVCYFACTMPLIKETQGVRQL